MRKLVSIIVPCYNLERYILDCLKSIAKLNYQPLEIIVVDDGSTDNSTSLVSAFIKNNTWGAKLSLSAAEKWGSVLGKKHRFTVCYW